MPYVVEVDQSIKVEQAGATVIAVANGIAHAIVIPSHVKTACFEALRERCKSKQVGQLLLFAACLYLVLEDYLRELDRVLIDIEYFGKDAEIKAFLLRYIRRKVPRFEAEKIAFKNVGRSSPADRKARAVRQGKDRKYRRVKLEE